jgi:UDP-N-acetylmuramyl pentapeptide phosphotransferase/UDP-N-acetylglucosamine-1-phosphate transferase
MPKNSKRNTWYTNFGKIYCNKLIVTKEILYFFDEDILIYEKTREKTDDIEYSFVDKHGAICSGNPIHYDEEQDKQYIDLNPIREWIHYQIIFYGDITLSHITAFGFNIQFGVFAYPITLFFILGCINVIRLIDGLDGLSGGISSIFFLTIGVISFLQQRFGTLEITLTFIMLGSTLGFLVHNFNPAKTFAGETGATFMGFIIAVISLLGFKGALLTSVLVPLLILAIPILDTTFAIIRRVIKHKPISEGDKDHMHHQFLQNH